QCATYCCLCFQAEHGIRDDLVTGVQTCALPISAPVAPALDTRAKEQPESARPLAADGLMIPRILFEASTAEGATLRFRVRRLFQIGRASCRERVQVSAGSER